MTATRFETVEAYIDSFPEQIGERLRLIRRIASEEIPEAGERISYGIAAVTLAGRDVVFYSGWKRHVAVYPLPAGDEELDRELDAHRAGKGTLQFPHDRPLPEDLLRRVVAALAAQRALASLAGKAPRSDTAGPDVAVALRAPLPHPRDVGVTSRLTGRDERAHSPEQ